MSTPPTLSGLEAPAVATITLTDEVLTFKLDSIPSVITNIKLIICASETQSNDISRAYSKAATFGDPETPVTSALDISDDYEAKYGVVGAGKPRVFFGHFVLLLVHMTNLRKDIKINALQRFYPTFCRLDRRG